jgi:hypothetical protein
MEILEGDWITGTIPLDVITNMEILGGDWSEATGATGTVVAEDGDAESILMKGNQGHKGIEN